jgi:hypothetical protein
MLFETKVRRPKSLLRLCKGKTILETYLYNQKDEMGRAYFTEVERLK